MSENESPAIDYRAEHEKLTKQVETANAESARRKAELKELRAEMEGLRTKAGEADTLKGEIRLMRHKDGLKSLYEDKELGLNPKIPVEKLIKIVGYEASTDEFDAKATKEMLAGLKESDSFLFAEQKSEEESVNSKPPIQAPAWASRGVINKAGTKVELTDAHYRDPVFMYELAQSQAQAK